MQRNAIYKTRQWEETRNKVLEMDHYECQCCNHNMFQSTKPKKKTRATLVHHIWYVDKYPEYKYQIFVGGKRNLVALCHDCHEELHGRRAYATAKPQLNNERYD